MHSFPFHWDALWAQIIPVVVRCQRLHVPWLTSTLLLLGAFGLIFTDLHYHASTPTCCDACSASGPLANYIAQDATLTA